VNPRTTGGPFGTSGEKAQPSDDSRSSSSSGADPVAIGLVASLGHPGGNLTGPSALSPIELMPKRLELLFPRLVSPRLGVDRPAGETRTIRLAERIIGNMHEAGAGAKGVQLAILMASTESEIDRRFSATLVQRKAGGARRRAQPMRSSAAGTNSW